VGELFVGRYELVDPLGHGASGVVFRTRDHSEHEYVAAKVLRQVDAPALMRFVREQSMRVRHAHVVPVLGWAGTDDRVLFTMPIVAGVRWRRCWPTTARCRCPGYSNCSIKRWPAGCGACGRPRAP